MPDILQSAASHDPARRRLAEELSEAGRRLDARGLAAATSGNYSARMPDGSLLVTRSGQHKGRLDGRGYLRLDPDGASAEEGTPSAEAALHIMLYRRFPDAHAVLHWHSPVMAALTRMLAPGEDWRIEGHEMLKALPGITSHDCSVAIPVVDNSQDMAEIEAAVGPALDRAEAPPAFLIRAHGAYVWGSDVSTAERIAEALEWLVAADVAERSMKGMAR